MSLVLMLLLGGCRGAPSPGLKSLDSEHTREWLARHREYRAPASPSADEGWSVVAADSRGGELVWVQQQGRFSRLWKSSLLHPEERAPLLEFEAPRRLFWCAQSPDSQRVLLLEEVSNSLQRARLLLLELQTGELKTLSESASADFKVQWLDSERFLWAQFEDRTVRVLERSLHGPERLLMEHTAAYPRLQLHRLSPQGWLVLDRNRRTDFHGWIQAQADAGGEWLELQTERELARPLGWRKGKMLWAVRDGPGLTRVREATVERGRLAFDGRVVGRIGSVEQAFLSNDSIFYVGFESWNHGLFRLDLESGDLHRLSWGFEPAQSHAFQPLENGLGLVRVEGVLQPPALFLLGEKSVRRLVAPEPALSSKLVDFHAERGLVTITPRPDSGDTPVLLEAYGGFQESIRPYFDPVRVRWLKRGGKVVISLTQRENRRETVEALVKLARSQDPRRVAYRGSSFGGTLGLMSLFAAPDAFDAIWVDAPLTDLLEYVDFYPGETWVEDLGDPSETETARELLAFSPLHQINDERFPPLIVSTALDDPVVHASHSLRFVDQWEKSNSGAIHLELQERGIHQRPPLPYEEYQRLTDLLWTWANK